MLKQPYLFDDFHIKFLRRKPASEQAKLAAKLREFHSKSFDQLEAIFGCFMDTKALKPSESGSFSRRRCFSLRNTFWMFLKQSLSADHSCRAALQEFQATMAERNLPIPTSCTGAYAKARQKLPLELIEAQLTHTMYLADEQNEDTEGFEKHRVITVDGTGFSMPDTEANQKEWPQPSGQNEGCGFPVLKLVGAFYLNSGVLMDYAISDLHSHELRTFRSMKNSFKSGDILLGDRAYCSFADMGLYKLEGIDSVLRLHQARSFSRSGKCIKRHSKNDQVFRWTKPKARPKSFGPEEWDRVPETLDIREIRITCKDRAGQKSEVIIASTLTDAEAYPAQRIAELYLKRWAVETRFSELKTTMEMDVLRCKTPMMIRKELAMAFLGYNCLRLMIWEIAKATNRKIISFSFSWVLGTVRHCVPRFAMTGHKDLKRQVRELYAILSDRTLLQRPGRSEPRVKKRRGKNFKFLTKSRSQMRECLHRNRYTATTC